MKLLDTTFLKNYNNYVRKLNQAKIYLQRTENYNKWYKKTECNLKIQKNINMVTKYGCDSRLDTDEERINELVNRS